MTRAFKIQTVLLAALFSLPLQAHETPSAEQAKMMKAFEKAGKVTKHHKALAYLAGEWQTKSKWWPGPGAKPEETDGKTRFESLLGGRFIRETMDGMSMGKPFQGIGYLGYDNMKKKYVTTWMDNMSTGIFMLEGDSPDGGGTIKSSGKFACPILGKDKSIRSVMTKVGRNKVRYEHYEIDPSGKEFKALEVVYTR